MSFNTESINKIQQQNYQFWMEDRGLADAPFAPAAEATHQENAEVGLLSKKTTIHICHVVRSCHEFKRRPREVQLFLKIASALGLSKEHYIVVDAENIQQKMALFSPKSFILWGMDLDQLETISQAAQSIEVIKTFSHTQILQNPDRKREVWNKIQSLKLN